MGMSERLADIADPGVIPSGSSSKRSICRNGYAGANAHSTTRSNGPGRVCLCGSGRRPRLMGGCGRAYARQGKRNLRIRSSWLEHPARFSLEPALAVGPGLFIRRPTCRCSVRSATRAGPLGTRAHAPHGAQARGTGEAGPRTLREIDFLLLVDDEARQAPSVLPTAKAGRSSGKRVSRAYHRWSSCPGCFRRAAIPRRQGQRRGSAPADRPGSSLAAPGRKRQ